MTSQPQPLRRWAVHAHGFPFGIGERIGTVKAPDRRSAERLVLARWGLGKGSCDVSLAGGRKRHKRPEEQRR